MTATPFATLAKLAERLSSLPIELWSKLRSGTFASYHLEHHYMRGPGPKWHEKHPGAPSHGASVERLNDHRGIEHA